MTTFLLIRHGQTDAAGKILSSRPPGCDLNSTGRAQVARLAQQLSRVQISAVYTSPLERALQTAEAISGPHSLTPQPRAALAEFNFGNWDAMSINSLEQDTRWPRFNAYRSSVRAPA